MSMSAKKSFEAEISAHSQQIVSKILSCWPWQLVWSTKTDSFDNELNFHLRTV